MPARDEIRSPTIATRRATSERHCAIDGATDREYKLTADDVFKMLQNENTIYFSPAPSRMMVWADYMNKVGLLSNRPAS